MAAYTADGVRAAYVSLSQFGLEPRTHTVRNIVALLACFFLLGAPLHLPQAARCSEPVNSGCDANIKQYHSIPYSV